MKNVKHDIAQNHYVLRFVYDELWDIDSKRKLFVLSDVFRPRFDKRANETSLSVTWVDFFTGNTFDNFKKATDALCNNIRPKTSAKGKLSKNSLIAKIKVNDLVQICSGFGVDAKVQHAHSQNNPAHATITFYVQGKNLYENILNGRSNIDVDFTDMNEALIDNNNIQFYTLKSIRSNQIKH